MASLCTRPAVFATALILVALSAHAGRLEFGQPRVDGENVVMPIVLTGDNAGGVSTMNFDLKYDPQVFHPVHVAQGDAAKAADKQVQFHVRNDGDARVIVVGLNQAVMQGGEVAQVYFQKVGSGDQSNLRIVNTTFAASDASEIPSRGDSQAVRLDGATPETTPDESGYDDANTTPGSSPTRDSASPSPTSPTSPTSPAERRAAPGAGSADPQANLTPQQRAQLQADRASRPAQSPQQPVSTQVRVMDEGERGNAGSQAGLTGAIQDAENARSSIATPPSPSGEAIEGTSPASAAVAAGEMSEDGALADSESVQIARADDPRPRTTDRTSPAPTAAAGTDTEQPERSAAGEPAAAQAGSGGNATVPLVVGAVIVAAIIGLMVVRRKLFA